MFGQIAPGVTAYCGANIFYSYFYTEMWPIITMLSVTIIPTSCMIVFLVAITISINKRRNRVISIQPQDERRRTRFMHRQMLILMLVTLVLFTLTTFPVALFRFTISTLRIEQPFSLSLVLAAIFDLITLANYSLNFYLHCLTSTLFRTEFFKSIPCAITINFRQPIVAPT